MAFVPSVLSWVPGQGIQLITLGVNAMCLMLRMMHHRSLHAHSPTCTLHFAHQELADLFAIMPITSEIEQQQNEI